MIFCPRIKNDIKLKLQSAFSHSSVYIFAVVAEKLRNSSPRVTIRPSGQRLPSDKEYCSRQVYFMRHKSSKKMAERRKNVMLYYFMFVPPIFWNTYVFFSFDVLHSWILVEYFDRRNSKYTYLPLQLTNIFLYFQHSTFGLDEEFLK